LELSIWLLSTCGLGSGPGVRPETLVSNKSQVIPKPLLPEPPLKGKGFSRGEAAGIEAQPGTGIR
jgi:hypothetical protein